MVKQPIITNHLWDFMPMARERFPNRKLTIVPVAMEQWAHVIMDADTCENVADILYHYPSNGGHHPNTLFGYKYQLKWLMKPEKESNNH